jgi:serine/threonine-protein phosphatase 2A regulatory subunit B
MEREPVKTIPIHEHLRPRLCDTYENDSIFDKFEVVFSGDAKNVMTGSYNNNFMIYPSEEGKDTEVVLQADKSAFKAKKVGIPTPMNTASSPGTGKDGKKGSRANSPAGGAQRMRKETDADQIDFNKKILHMSWHPQEDSIAIAATNNVSCLDLGHALAPGFFYILLTTFCSSLFSLHYRSLGRYAELARLAEEGNHVEWHRSGTGVEGRT